MTVKINEKLKIGDHEFNSRLIIGTGKYRNYQETKDCLELSGAEMITVAVKKVNIESKRKELLQDYIDPEKYTYLPNTAGCFTAKEAVRILEFARDIGNWNLVKLEVLSDPKTLYPDMIATIEAARELVKNNFQVMVYTTDDLILCKKLVDIGCVAVMPLGSPIGSGQGILNPFNIKLIAKEIEIPVILDAGIGSASDASKAMELGCDGVLLNSAIARAQNPKCMSKAMKFAVKSGRMSFLAGKMDKNDFAVASSPLGKEEG